MIKEDPSPKSFLPGKVMILSPVWLHRARRCRPKQIPFCCENSPQIIPIIARRPPTHFPLRRPFLLSPPFDDRRRRRRPLIHLAFYAASPPPSLPICQLLLILIAGWSDDDPLARSPATWGTIMMNDLAYRMINSSPARSRNDVCFKVSRHGRSSILSLI